MQYKKVALNLAYKAGKIMLSYFSLGMKKSWKKDRSPVTWADISINKMVIEEIEKNFPSHSIIGEEENKIKEGEFSWICDPIDGTVPFSHGCPTFMFSLALTQNGESILGVLYDPILNRMYYAEKGKGSFLNGKRIFVSKSRILKNSIVGLDSDRKFKHLIQEFINLKSYVPIFYSATYPSSLVACGEFSAYIYAYDKPWDGAAVKIIVEEAGGKVTDLNGCEQRYDKKLNGFVATNGNVHKKVLNLINRHISSLK